MPALPHAHCLQFECYEYLFEAAVRMRQLGLDAGRPPAPPALAAANGHAEGAERAAKKARLGAGVASLVGFRWVFHRVSSLSFFAGLLPAHF